MYIYIYIDINNSNLEDEEEKEEQKVEVEELISLRREKKQKYIAEKVNLVFEEDIHILDFFVPNTQINNNNNRDIILNQREKLFELIENNSIQPYQIFNSNFDGSLNPQILNGISE